MQKKKKRLYFRQRKEYKLSSKDKKIKKRDTNPRQKTKKIRGYILVRGRDKNSRKTMRKGILKKRQISIFSWFLKNADFNLFFKLICTKVFSLGIFI